MVSKSILVFLLFSASSIYGYSTGAPEEACGDMKPQHPFNPKTTQFPYNVTISKVTANQGEKLQIKISGWIETKFKGFLVQVRDNEGPVGYFDIPKSDNNAQGLNCGSKNNAATHKSSDVKDFVELDWIAPSKYKGKLSLYATVAKDGEVYWVRQKSHDIQVV